MWFKLAGADFSKNNLGTMSSISSSYLIDYTGLTGMSGSPSSVSYAGSSAGTSKTASVVVTVTSGYTFKQGSTITASGGKSGTVFTADKDYTGGQTFTFSMAITANTKLSGTAEATGGSSSGGNTGGGGFEGDEPETPVTPTNIYTITKGSAYAVSTANSANRATINPVTIKIPNGVTITPKDGYNIGIFYAVNPDDPTNGYRCPDGWNLTEWTGNGVTTIGLCIKKSDNSDFSDSDFGKPISDFVDSTDSSIWEVKEEVVPTRYTLYVGNWFDDNSSNNKMQNRATHDPYTIVVPSGVVITPKSGYQISVWSGLNKYDIPTPNATFTAWSSEAYTGTGREVGICIRKTDNSNFDFATESTFIGDYLDSTDTSIWEVK